MTADGMPRGEMRSVKPATERGRHDEVRNGC